MMVLLGISSLPRPKPNISLRRCATDLAHSLVAYTSASAVLRAVIFCRFELQCRGPFIHRRNPEIERVLNKSNVSVVPGLGFDASCGPQLASDKPVGRDGIGNLTCPCKRELDW